MHICKRDLTIHSLVKTWNLNYCSVLTVSTASYWHPRWAYATNSRNFLWKISTESGIHCEHMGLNIKQPFGFWFNQKPFLKNCETNEDFGAKVLKTNISGDKPVNWWLWNHLYETVILILSLLHPDPVLPNLGAWTIPSQKNVLNFSI